MSVVLQPVTVVTPHAPVRPAAPVQASEPASPLDAVVLSGAPLAGEAQASTTGTRWLAAGALALALASPMLASVTPLVHTMDETSISVSVSQSTTVPIDAARLDEMKRLAAPSEVDNETAADVKAGYGEYVADAEQYASLFTETRERLQGESANLQRWAERGAGKHYSWDAVVTVEQQGDATVISSESNGVSRQLTRRGDVTELRLDDGETKARMESTPRRVTVDADGVRATLHTADADGYRKGDFEVERTDGPRSRTKMLVRGLTVQTDTRRTVSGIAGDMDIQTREKFEIPEMSIQVHPRTDLRYSRTETRFDRVTGNESVSIREVEVRDDGSTRVRERGEGEQKDLSEPGKSSASQDQPPV